MAEELLQSRPELAALTVHFQNHLYATLDFTPPDSEELGPTAMPEPTVVPENWEVAPSRPEISDSVIGQHAWGTKMLVCRDGAGYTTKLWNGSHGSKISNFELKVHDGERFAPRRCLQSRPSRVLIRFPAGVSEPSNKDDWPIHAGEEQKQPPKLSNGEEYTPGTPPPELPSFVHERCKAELAGPAVPWTPITAELVMERHGDKAPGMLYGLDFPWSLDGLLALGPGWLTKAFHTAKTMPQDNRVTKILTDPGKVTIGNNGGKFFFSVQYEKQDPRLQTELFAKVPWPLEGKTRSDRLSSSVYKQPQELYELNTYRLLEATLPMRTPRFYFGDISNETSNWILITERVPFAAAEANEFGGPSKVKTRKPLGAWRVEGPYDKCMDWMLRGDSVEYYQLLVQAGAKLAGLHKCGKLGHEEALARNLENFLGRPQESWGMQPGCSGEAPKKVSANLDVALTFISDTGSVLFPDYARTQNFQSRVRSALMTLNAYKAELLYWRHQDPDFIALTHQNMNVDNAYFWRDEQGKLDLGVFDWGNMGARSLGFKLWWWLYCCDYEVLTQNVDAFLQTLVATYHEHGGPVLDKETLRDQFLVTALEQLLGLCNAVPQILRMCPKKEWATIQDRYDPRIAENVEGKSTLRLYLQVMRTVLRMVEEWDCDKVLERWLEGFYRGSLGKEPKPQAVIRGQ